MISSAAQAVQAPEVYEPETVMSKDQYWQDYKQSFYQGKATKAPGHYGDLNYRIAKFFGSGAENSFDAAYDAYLNNINNRNEKKSVQSAQAWDEYMSNTAYSRGFKDLENIGVNPYLLLNSGSTPANAVGSATKGSYQSKSSTKEASSNSRGRDIALLIFAIARLAAFL